VPKSPAFVYPLPSAGFFLSPPAFFVGSLLNSSTLSGLRIEMLRSGAKAADAENSRHDLRRLF
jgi:hypothetical protein